MVFTSGANATPPAGTVVSTEEVTNLNGSVITTGEEAQRVLLALRTGDGVVIDLPGDATNGLKVQGVLSLSSGASTLAEQQTQSTRLGDLTEAAPATDTASSGLNGRLQRLAQRLTFLIALLPTSLGQKLKAASFPVVIASDQDALPVSLASAPLPTGAATAANQATEIASLASLDSKVTAVNTGAVVVSSSALPSGAATSANQSAEQTLIGAVNETAPANDTASSGLNGRLQRVAQRLTSLIALLPASVGQKAMAASLAVVVASDQTVIPISDNSGSLTVDGSVTANPTRPATATSSNVSSSASNVTLLVSNAGRLGATVYNDSTAILYLKLGATASSSSHTLQMAAGGYFEVPFWYTGIIDGIWASANGSARLVEVTA